MGRCTNKRSRLSLGLDVHAAVLALLLLVVAVDAIALLPLLLGAFHRQRVVSPLGQRHAGERLANSVFELPPEALLCQLVTLRTVQLKPTSSPRTRPRAYWFSPVARDSVVFV